MIDGSGLRAGDRGLAVALVGGCNPAAQADGERARRRFLAAEPCAGVLEIRGDTPDPMDRGMISLAT
jgi:hypothetical protein